MGGEGGRGPYVEQTAEPAEAATPQNVRMTLPATDQRGRPTFKEYSVEWSENGMWIQEGRTAVTYDEPSARHTFIPKPVIDAAVAALVAAAEERGAAKERERCAAELKMAIDATSYDRVEPDWSVDGYAVEALANSWRSVEGT